MKQNDQQLVTLNNNQKHHEILAIVLYMLKQNYIVNNVHSNFDQTQTISFSKPQRPSDFYGSVTFMGIDEMKFRIDMSNEKIQVIHRNKIRNGTQVIPVSLNSRYYFKNNDKSSSSLIDDENFPQLDKFYAKFRFFDENHTILAPFIHKLHQYVKSPPAQTYSLNTFDKFKKCLPFANKFDALYDINKQKYYELIDFLDDFRSSSKISEFYARNWTVKKSANQHIILLLNNMLIFNETHLQQFKYIKHPSLCLLLHLVNDKWALQNKYNKHRLQRI